jgi:hypothetical protein
MEPIFANAIVAAVAAVALPFAVGAIVGIGALGPVAGGWFAAHQGAGLIAGGILPGVQSFVMGGCSLALAIKGALAGGALGAAAQAGLE